MLDAFGHGGYQTTQPSSLLCPFIVLRSVLDGSLEDSLAVQHGCPSIPYLMEVYINALTNDTVEIREILENEKDQIDKYTALVYGKFIVLASHLRVVESLGIVSPNIAVACNKFGHALCKMKQFRIALGMNTSLSDMCHYNPTIPFYSRAQKIGYSISVLKQGADSLSTILHEIREVTLRETRRCVCDSARQNKTLICD
ncbi:hypothetical protein CHS0354_014226 [Potamilus streckersoni]|uniref:Uncharacterized protein n=1 Tax=Potamilus streckersoni TaxID=2493646 RepID=A0AAE0T003_9BIVA|nr:hypothetical protein CHS0354_014226 [Potamilus streckersoni]